MRKKMTPLVALKRYWQLYLFLLIPLAYIITFKYAPMVGIQLAFKNFEYDKGLFGSPWIGLRHFQRFFGSYIWPRSPTCRQNCTRPRKSTVPAACSACGRSSCPPSFPSSSFT